MAITVDTDKADVCPGSFLKDGIGTGLDVITSVEALRLGNFTSPRYASAIELATHASLHGPVTLELPAPARLSQSFVHCRGWFAVAGGSASWGGSACVAGWERGPIESGPNAIVATEAHGRLAIGAGFEDGVRALDVVVTGLEARFLVLGDGIARFRSVGFATGNPFAAIVEFIWTRPTSAPTFCLLSQLGGVEFLLEFRIKYSSKWIV